MVTFRFTLVTEVDAETTAEAKEAIVSSMENMLADVALFDSLGQLELKTNHDAVWNLLGGD